MWDDLNGRLEQCEAHLREARELLQRQRRRQVTTIMPEGMMDSIAALAAAVVEADRASDAVCRAARGELSKRPGNEGPPGDVLPWWHWPPARPDEGPGNAPVGAPPRPVGPLRGPGAERTFEEAVAPPRNP